MDNVVFDTNIYVSAIFWEGKAYHLVRKAINKEIVVFISEAIIAEIRRVLERDFGIGKQEIDDAINGVLHFAQVIEPKDRVEIMREDPADDRILECALACRANFIVTYDKKLLRLKEFMGTTIITPELFYQR